MIPLARRLQLSAAPAPSAASLYCCMARAADAQRVQDRLFKRYSPAQLAKTRLGSHVICEDKQLIYEEAPEAYKPVDSIIASLEQAGLLTVLAKLRPVLTTRPGEDAADDPAALSSAQGPDECCLAVAGAGATVARSAGTLGRCGHCRKRKRRQGRHLPLRAAEPDGDGAASLAANWRARSNGPAPALTVRPTRARTGSSASCAAKRPRPAWPPTYALKRHARPDLAASTSTRRARSNGPAPAYRPSHPRKNWFIGVLLRSAAPPGRRHTL